MEKTVFKRFTKYILPSVFAMLGLSCYILADTLFVANVLGENGIAALNLAIPIFSIISAFGQMIGIGAASYYSLTKSKNAGDNRPFSFAVMLVAILGSIFMIMGFFFSRDISVLSGADSDTLEMTQTYIGTILAFAPVFMLSNVLTAFVRNDNAPRLAMCGMLSASFSNIILDYIFMYPLKMGMFGAVIATCIAPIISIMVLSIHFIRRKNSFSFSFKGIFDFTVLKKTCSMGLSSFLTELSSAVTIIVFNMIILSLVGNVGVAAYGIITNVALIVTSVLVGVAQGLQPLFSTAKGQGNIRELKAFYRMGLVTSVSIGILVYAAILLFGDLIADAFINGENALLKDTAVSGLYLYFSGFLVAGVNTVSAMLFSATGFAGQAFLVTALRGFVVLIPSAFLLSALFGMTGVWLSFAISEALTLAVSTVNIIRYMGSIKEIKSGMQ